MGTKAVLCLHGILENRDTAIEKSKRIGNKATQGKFCWERVKTDPRLLSPHLFGRYRGQTLSWPGARESPVDQPQTETSQKRTPNCIPSNFFTTTLQFNLL